jgi:Ala-tRNA(Pro) deacylase
MTIPSSVASYLDREQVRYDAIAHVHTVDSSHTAEAAHVPGGQFAKCVLLEDDAGYLMAVIPATHRLDLGAVHRQCNRTLGLATEPELAKLFVGCEPGAVPPLGKAFGIDSIVDESLLDREDIYFESGDHRVVVHVSGGDFEKLMADAPRGRFSHRAEPESWPREDTW